MKLLSIIVPLYNSARYLPKCLESLLTQDIPSEDYEIILVNDGSPDNSLKIAEGYASKNGNIRIYSQENSGTSGARNAGIRNATGKYLYFVDPDDYILENSLACILDKVEEENLDILRFGYMEVNEDYHPTSSVKRPPIIDYSPEIMDGCTFMGKRLGVACYVWTYLFRTSLIRDNNLFFIEGVYFDDTPWLPQVLRKASRVNSVNFQRHFYLIRGNSLVQSKDRITIRKKIEGQTYLINELKSQMETTNNSYALQWYRSVIAHCIVSLLSISGQQEKDEVQSICRFVSSSGALPLPVNGSTTRNRIKLRLINISPYLFCLIIKVKNIFK